MREREREDSSTHNSQVPGDGDPQKPQSISSSTRSVAKLLKEAPNVAPESPEERTSDACACVRACARTCVSIGGQGWLLRRQYLDGAIGMHGSLYETNEKGFPGRGNNVKRDAG